MKSANRWWQLAVSGILFIAFALSCGGGNGDPTDICNCTPSEPASQDYRHDAKHVSLPGSSGTQITVADILGWAVGTQPAGDAPRSGRELDMFFVQHAFAQAAGIVGVDCDIHVEISNTADKNAPRVIVETPIDSEYCDARNSLKSGLAAHGFSVSTSSGEITPAVPVSVLGLAFQDFEHTRGTALVKTTWELHPAIVTVLSQ